MRRVLLVGIVFLLCCLDAAIAANPNTPLHVQFANPQKQVFLANQPIRVGVRNGPIRGTKGQPQLIVRIFAGTRESLTDTRNRPRSAPPENCVVYPRTHVFTIDPIDNLIDISLNVTYLARNHRNEFFDTPYVMVVERGSTAEIFKIDPDEVRKYFSMGYEFVLKARILSQGIPIPIEMTSELKERLTRSDSKKKSRDQTNDAAAKTGYKGGACLLNVQ